jgi:hypothetical protein
LTTIYHILNEDIVERLFATESNHFAQKQSRLPDCDIFSRLLAMLRRSDLDVAAG